jgi:hypothetical protein
MRKRVVIRSAYPSSEAVAAEFGISQKRMRELRKLIGFDQRQEKTKPTAKKRSSRG